MQPGINSRKQSRSNRLVKLVEAAAGAASRYQLVPAAGACSSFSAVIMLDHSAPDSTRPCMSSHLLPGSQAVNACIVHSARAKWLLSRCAKKKKASGRITGVDWGPAAA